MITLKVPKLNIFMQNTKFHHLNLILAGMLVANSLLTPLVTNAKTIGEPTKVALSPIFSLGANNNFYSENYKNKIETNQVGLILGKKGPAYQFDGNKDYIKIPEDKSLNVANEFTVSIWVKTLEDRLNSTTKQREILFREGSNLMFGYEYENKEEKIWLRLYAKYEDGKTQEVEWRDMGKQSTRDGKWHHFAATYKRNDRFKLYIDGKLVDSEIAPDKAVKLSSDHNSYILGARMKDNGAVDRNLKADLDELNIFDVSLDQSAITELYQIK